MPIPNIDLQLGKLAVGGALWPNDPLSLGTPGWQLVTDYGFTDPMPDGSASCQQFGTSGWANDNGNSITGGGLSFVTDATAPNPAVPGWSSRVLQFYYPAGFVAGVAPATLSYGPNACGFPAWPNGGTSDTYVGFWFKYSSNWYNEGASNKLGEVWDNNNGPDGYGTYIEYAFGTVGQNPLTTNAEVEAPPYIVTFDLPPNINSTVITLNQWHLWESRWTYTRSGLPGTGNYQRWLDGIPQANYPGIQLKGSAISTYQIFPDWGGGGNTVPADQFLWWAHIRITGHA